MSKMKSYTITCGPFAQARQNVNAFCHNLFLSNAMDECARRLGIVQEEYEQALMAKNDALAAQKRAELQTYQSSLQLTAHMIAEIDEIEV